MNTFYIYSYQYKDIERGQPALVSATVIFCSSEEINENDLQVEIRKFYQTHYQTDKIVVIGHHRIVSRLIEVFITNQNQTFKGVPKRNETFLNDNLLVASFDQKGQLHCQNGKVIPKAFKESYKNEGLQQIFISRGGVIVSEASHHYVFPSGKHCDRFLRTGNILLYSPEIYFIAFALLYHFDEDIYNRIYCDTSSINSIAFALFDLKNSFLQIKKSVSIESFSSYEGLYKNPETYSKDAFLLVSASTSANIIKYILDKHKIIDRDNIIILYFLGKDKDYSNVKDQVLCNLTQSTDNKNGIAPYPTYTDLECEFCKKGSYAVPVAGDVFLLEKPKVNKILLAVSDREKGLSKFVQQFISQNKKKSVFKVHFKEGSQDKYEIFIDLNQILKDLHTHPNYTGYRDKLNHFIQQYIPSNTKYLLYLEDEGSKALCTYIFQQISPYYNAEAVPTLLSQEKLQQINENVAGAIVIVGSCISNGKNLLYISRALRKFDKLRIVYFNGITRTANKESLEQLKQNLKRGRYGADTNGFIAVESIFCSNHSKQTAWLAEIEFLKEIIEFTGNNHPDFTESIAYFTDRKACLEQLAGEQNRGMTETLFYERITTPTPERLSLRKNFAFFDFDDYEQHVTQADVYFTISNIINSLRNSGNIDKQLKQAVYVRNLLDPANFNRFNDGIIQASLLRAACADELAYSIHEGISQEMYNTLETTIRYHEQEQGEALLEFLYALATKKMSLYIIHINALLDQIASHCKKELFHSFAAFIKWKLIDEPELLKNSPLPIVESITETTTISTES